MKKLNLLIFICTLFFLGAGCRSQQSGTQQTNQIKQTQEKASAPQQHEPSSGPGVPYPYKACPGISFGDSCPNESCIADGIERRVFNLWKEQFIKKHGLSTSYFNEHFEITDVYFHETYLWWRVDYVFKIDWVRAFKRETIPLSGSNDFTSIEKLTDEQINRALKAYSFPHKMTVIDKVITEDQLEPLTKEKHFGKPVSYNFCNIGLGNEYHGHGLFLLGGGIIDYDQNRCFSGSINLLDGTSSFNEEVCYIGGPDL